MKLHIFALFYHIKNLQSTKTTSPSTHNCDYFITLRIYKVLKLELVFKISTLILSH